MDYPVYLAFRALTLAVGALPLTWVFRLGRLGGWLAYVFLPPYRRVAVANLLIAYGGERSPSEIRRLARQHFLTLGANALCSLTKCEDSSAYITPRPMERTPVSCIVNCAVEVAASASTCRTDPSPGSA